ncbi:YunG family protein [Amycolatopsis sp.]|uniref:YunG family protein n=1 Tax=Amycolatopsis sp. TaxID=37632 RepID=UPI003BB874D8
MPGGLDVDLTHEQFSSEELISDARIIDRPAGPPRRCREQYDLLRARVLARLGLPNQPVERVDTEGTESGMYGCRRATR